MHIINYYAHFLSIIMHTIPNFSVAIWSVLRQKINFWKVRLSLLENQLIYNFNSLHCFDNNTAESTY